jgi:fibronectin type 3 domain-containing protein
VSLADNVTSTSFTDTAPPSGSVEYAVKAHKGTLTSDLVSDSVNVPLPLSSPVIVTAQQSDGTVLVTWDAVDNATDYVVNRRVAGTATWTQVGTVTATSFVDTTVPLGDFEYSVTAANSSNSVESNVDDITVTLNPPVVTADTTSPGEVIVTWNAVNNATRYSVWVKVAGGAWTSLSSNATGGSFVHTNPAVGTAQYAVKAHNGTIVSGFIAVTVNVSDMNSAATTLPPFGAPVVNAVIQGDGAVSITWGEVQDATRYSVWYQAAGGTWTLLSSNAADGSFVHTNPPIGTVKYTVKAHNGSIVSAFVAVTLSIPDPLAP